MPIPHLRSPRPRDVLLAELAALAELRHDLTAQLAAVDRQINRRLEDYTRTHEQRG